MPRERAQHVRHDQADEADDAGDRRRRADAERRAGDHGEPRARQGRCRGCAAASSPSVRASSARPTVEQQRHADQRSSGALSHTCVRLRSASEPIIQNTISTEANGFCDRLRASEISAVAMLETASPARISVTGPPCAPASATTASMATAAPASPPSGSAKRERLRQAQMDRQHRAQRRAARDADQARLGQRIAQIALQRRARQPERAAHQRAQHGARQADLR